LINKFIEKYFNTKVCIFFLILIGSLIIFISNYLYTYDITLSKQDSRNYILLAENLDNYFYLYHQVSLRIFPSLIVNFFHTFTSINIFYSFKILSYISFLLLLLKLFFFLKKFQIKSYFAFSSVLILIFFNSSIIYLIFNTYQFLDILLYIFSLYIIESSIFNKKKTLFFFSFLSLFTKEYLLILIIASYLNNYLIFKNKKIFYQLLFLITVFLVHFYFAGSLNNQESTMSDTVKLLSFSYSNLIYLVYQCLILENNILLFFPFVILLFDKNFIIFIKNFHFIIGYIFFLIFMTILNYDLVGNNFFRVYYHSFFIFILFVLIYLIKKISDFNFLKKLYFFLPFLFLLDFFYILKNIKQTGFFYYYQYFRYNYLSSYYIFFFLFLYIIFISNKKYKQ
jgi:hypothetical protein